MTSFKRFGITIKDKGHALDCMAFLMPVTSHA